MSTSYSIRAAQDGLYYEDAVEQISARIPKGLRCSGLVSLPEPEAPDAGTLMARAMQNAFGPSLRELAAGKKSAAILVSDATRAVATPLALPHIISELQAAGMALKDIFLVVAIGVHRNATHEEMNALSGALSGQLRVANHDPYTSNSLVLLGKSSLGTGIEVNKAVVESDLRIMIGKVEPHEFAGFSGGRKSVLPGISSERCIRRNHRPENILHPKSSAGNLDGNIIHQEMLEAAKMLRLDFCVNMAQNAAGQPLACFCGELEASHAAAVDFVSAHYGAALEPSSNIYLTTPGSPLNIDLYQSIKPLIALEPALKAGDIVVLYSRCREGVASPDMMKPFASCGSLDAVTAYLTEHYTIQMDHALLLCKLYTKGVSVVAVSPGVSPEEFRTLRMNPAPSLQAALETAAEILSAKGIAPVLSIVPAAQRLVIRPA